MELDKNNTVAPISRHPDFNTSNENESVDAQQLPDCPDYLSPLAKRHWPELLESLGRHNNLINELDKDAIGIYCSMMARFIELDEKLDDVGMTQKTKNGYEAETGTFTAWNKLIKPIMAYAKQLGLTPPARVALNMQDPEQTDIFKL